MNSLHKIAVIGDTGSGKTTFARILSEKLKLPHYDGDAYRFVHGHKRTDEEFLSDIEKITSQPKWLLDSSHTLACPLACKRADIVFFFKFPIRILLYRTLKRALRRLLTGETYADGRKEDLAHLFGKDGWITKFYPRLREKREKYERYLRTEPEDSTHLITFTHPRDVRDYLKNIISLQIYE